MAAVGNTASGSFEQYTHDVYGWAYRLLGRHHDAMDVVQDVFLRWNAQCAHSSPVQPRGWLRRVTLNRAIDLRRRTKTIPGGDEALARIPSTDTMGLALDHEVLRADIAAALDRVTDVQRGVLVAKVYDGMTFARIAIEIGISVPTVKTHYLRAVRAMRDRLERRWAPEETR